MNVFWLRGSSIDVARDSIFGFLLLVTERVSVVFDLLVDVVELRQAIVLF